MNSETIDDLLSEVKVETSAPEESPTASANDNNTDNIDKKRAELIKSSEDGEIENTVKYVKKASAKVIERLYAELEAKRLERANAFLTDMLLSKYADLLGGLDAIESSEELAKDLQRDALLKRDVNSLVRYITPFLPFLGILNGGVTTAQHIFKHTPTSEQQTDNDNKNK